MAFTSSRSPSFPVPLTAVAGGRAAGARRRRVQDQVGAAARPGRPPRADPGPPAPAKTPLRVAYSDWPGWTAWEIAIQKGWFKEEGVDVEFSWFDYLPSLEAFTAGKVDAVTVTNGDALVTGANGAKSKLILVNDYSNGNDQIIARPGHQDLQGPEGQEGRPGADAGRAPAVPQGAREVRHEARATCSW